MSQSTDALLAQPGGEGCMAVCGLHGWRPGGKMKKAAVAGG